MLGKMFSSKNVALALVFAVLAALVFGCVSQDSGQPAAGADSGTPSINKTNLSMGDNKTGFDKTQEAIALAVADGTYVSSETYSYHSGNETVEIKITVENDTITAASVEPSSEAHDVSKKIIGNFNAALPELVVGKKIDKLDIPKNVAGSSLTTAAFKQYVDELVLSKGQQSS